jgi:hypothetical protein
MRTSRQAYLDKCILRAVEACGSFPLPESALRDQLSVRLAPPARTQEIDDSLRYLESERRITAIEGETCLAWILTTAGKGWLAANHPGAC